MRRYHSQNVIVRMVEDQNNISEQDKNQSATYVTSFTKNGYELVEDRECVNFRKTIRGLET